MLLFNSTTSYLAYEGDGILIGDSETNIPFTSINWKITQQLEFDDSYQTVSLFAVPQRLARRHLYRYRSYFKSDYFPVNDRAQTQSVASRSYVYQLPQMYLGRGEHAKAKISVQVKSKDDGKLLGAPVYQFQTLRDFMNFRDLQPDAVDNAVGCSCMLGEVINSCSPDDEHCIDKLRIAAGYPNRKECSAKSNLFFTSEVTSYNFFAAKVPTNSTVRYETNIIMYFYNTTAFEEYFICTIRGIDTCSFSTKGGFKKFQSWRERRLIIAYIHPTNVPSSLTTRIVVQTEVQIGKMALMVMLVLLIIYLVIRHCFHNVLCLFGRRSNKVQ